MPPVVGIDFGTTNSVVAVLQPDGRRDGDPLCRRHREPRSVPLRALLLGGGGPRPQVAAPGGRAGRNRRLPRRSARQPADHVDEKLPGAAQLHPDPVVRPPVHARATRSDCSCARCSRPRASTPSLATRARTSSPAARCASPASSPTTSSARRGCAAAFAEAGLGDIDVALEPEGAGLSLCPHAERACDRADRRFRRRHQRFLAAALRPRAAPRQVEAARPWRHRHRGRCVRLPHHRPRDRAAARQGRHLPRDRHDRPASPAGILLIVRPLASAQPDAQPTHAGRHRGCGAATLVIPSGCAG